MAFFYPTVDDALMKALIAAESGGNQSAVSPKGAIGKTQLMPATAKELGVDPKNPEQNVEGGKRYLQQHLDKYDGDLEKALTAYNWGPGNVAKGGVPPPETKSYVKRILSSLNPVQAATAAELPVPSGKKVDISALSPPAGKKVDISALSAPTETQKIEQGLSEVPGAFKRHAGIAAQSLLETGALYNPATALPMLAGDVLTAGGNYVSGKIREATGTPERAYGGFAGPYTAPSEIGRQAIRGLERTVGIEPALPQTTGEQLTAAAFAGAGGLLAGRVPVPAAIKSLPIIERATRNPLVLGKLPGGPLSDVVVGGSSGLAAEGGRAVAEKAGFGPGVQTAASLVAGIPTAILATGATNAARSLTPAGRAGAGATQVSNAVASDLQSMTRDPEALANRIRAGREQIREVVPGARPTAGQASGNPTVLSTEQAIIRRYPPVGEEIRGDLHHNTQAVVRQVAALKPGGDPLLAQQEFRAQINAATARIETAAEARHAEAVAAANAQTAAAGTEAARLGQERGSALRGYQDALGPAEVPSAAAEAARAAATAARDTMRTEAEGIFSAIDPTGTVTVSPKPIYDRAQAIVDRTPSVIERSALPKIIRDLVGDSKMAGAAEAEASAQASMKPAQRQLAAAMSELDGESQAIFSVLSSPAPTLNEMLGVRKMLGRLISQAGGSDHVLVRDQVRPLTQLKESFDDALRTASDPGARTRVEDALSWYKDAASAIRDKAKGIGAVTQNQFGKAVDPTATLEPFFVQGRKGAKEAMGRYSAYVDYARKRAAEGGEHASTWQQVADEATSSMDRYIAARARDYAGRDVRSGIPDATRLAQFRADYTDAINAWQGGKMHTALGNPIKAGQLFEEALKAEEDFVKKGVPAAEAGANRTLDAGARDAEAMRKDALRQLEDTAVWKVAHKSPGQAMEEIFKSNDPKAAMEELWRAGSADARQGLRRALIDHFDNLHVTNRMDRASYNIETAMDGPAMYEALTNPKNNSVLRVAFTPDELAKRIKLAEAASWLDTRESTVSNPILARQKAGEDTLTGLPMIGLRVLSRGPASRVGAAASWIAQKIWPTLGGADPEKMAELLGRAVRDQTSGLTDTLLMKVTPKNEYQWAKRVARSLMPSAVKDLEQIEADRRKNAPAPAGIH